MASNHCCRKSFGPSKGEGMTTHDLVKEINKAVDKLEYIKDTSAKNIYTKTLYEDLDVVLDILSEAADREFREREKVESPITMLRGTMKSLRYAKNYIASGGKDNQHMHNVANKHLMDIYEYLLAKEEENA